MLSVNQPTNPNLYVTTGQKKNQSMLAVCFSETKQKSQNSREGELKHRIHPLIEHRYRAISLFRETVGRVNAAYAVYRPRMSSTGMRKFVHQRQREVFIREPEGIIKVYHSFLILL